MPASITGLIGSFHEAPSGKPDLLDTVITDDRDDIPLGPGQEPGRAGESTLIGGLNSDGGTGEMTSPAESPEDHPMVPDDDRNIRQGLTADPAGVMTTGDPQSPGSYAPEHAGLTAGSSGPPVAPGKPQGFLSQFWDAVSVRTTGLVIGVLLLQIAFIVSYVGAFHSPAPHRIPLAVVAPAPESGPIVTRLNLIPSAPLHATAAPSLAAARRLIRDDAVSAALVINPAAKTDTLLVASAAGSAEASAAEQVITAAEASAHRSVTVTDLVPVQPGDYRGLTGFYLVVGWSLGGYLVAALLGITSGARPATTRRALNRLIAFGLYAIISGLAGAIVVGPVLGALTGHLIALWWLGALLVFAVGAVTLAFQTLFGVIGIGITILFFVILGNPSAGGAYQPALLPPFWRAISSALPNGAATDTVRRIVYFGAYDIIGHLIVLASYAVAGVVVIIIGSIIREHRTTTGQPGRGRPLRTAAFTPPSDERCAHAVHNWTI
jgi:hypothetical protein